VPDRGVGHVTRDRGVAELEDRVVILKGHDEKATITPPDIDLGDPLKKIPRDEKASVGDVSFHAFQSSREGPRSSSGEVERVSAWRR